MPSSVQLQYRHTQAQFLPDFRLGFQKPAPAQAAFNADDAWNDLGVAAVVSMLSIGAGAQQQVMAFIEQLECTT